MPPDSRIKHIVVLMMENRSFDHMLGFMKNENPAIRGITPNSYSNVDSNGNVLPVTDGALYQGQLVADPGHDFTDVYMQMYGVTFGNPAGQPDMSGFAKSYQQQGGNAADIMRCFNPNQLPALAGLARQYAICDQWFSSIPGPTLPNRAFAHFGTSFGRLDMSPEYFRAKPSIYQRLDKAGKEGTIYYYATWSGTLGLTFLLSSQNQYFALWGDFLIDCKHGQLPEYSFIEPAYHDQGNILACDQHPDHDVRSGDDFIRQVYNAIRSNDELWKSTLLLVVWDEHGGIFDHEVPPMVSHPDGFISTAPPFNFDRLGLRVPAIVISAYTPPGTVDHTVYEHASIPATVTEQFIGDPLALAPYAREKYANTFLGLLTLDEPRTDTANLQANAAVTAVSQPQPRSAAPASSLQLNQVAEVHAILQQNHPDVAQQLDPASVDTEQDASQFISAALAVIHPGAAQSETGDTNGGGGS